MALFQEAGSQFKAIWARLSPGHRLILILLLVLCVGAVVAVSLYAGAPEYEVLCSGLSGKESAALLAALKDARIPVRIAQGGEAILVPANRMDRARMAAAEKGILRPDRSAFDAFREPKIGMTPFAERVNYIVALQNELASTITSLESVMYARVHLAIPERTVFGKDSRRPTASVLVIPQGNRQLTPGQVTAIANLVASAVEGMSPEDVTVSDARGNVLAGASQEGLHVAADEQFLCRQRIESYLSEKAETMLAAVLGPGCCDVRVNAELVFEDSRETRREYDPDKRVLVSERIESSTTIGRPTQVGGPAGSANVPGGEPASAAPAQAVGQSKTENVDTRYVASELVRETVYRGATIKRLAVAAFVDLSGLSGAAEGASAASVTVEDIGRVIREAIGFDESRGDTLKIVESKFLAAETPAGALAGGVAPKWAVTAAQYFAIGVLGLVLLLVARRLMRSIQTAAPRPAIVPEIMGAEPGAGGRLPGGEDELIRREIARFVQGNPQAASRLLEGWVEGEE